MLSIICCSSKEERSRLKKREINAMVFLVDIIYGGIECIIWVLNPLIYLFTFFQRVDLKLRRAAINSMANREVESIKKEMRK